MAIAKIGEDSNFVKSEFMLDSEEDLASLPASHPGSTAIIPEAGQVYMVNASGDWVEFSAEG